MQINLDLSQIIIAVINFLVLYLILKKILFKPVMKIMKERQDNIIKSVEENDKKKELLDGLRGEYDSALKNQEILKKKIILESKQKATEEYNQILKNAKDKSKNIHEAAKSKIEEERELMLQNVKKDITSISVLIASKVTDENMNTEKNNELANKFLREVNIK
jgi:F-type H+-transporting ATPase subunit b